MKILDLNASGIILEMENQWHQGVRRGMPRGEPTQATWQREHFGHGYVVAAALAGVRTEEHV